ncbi:hypothetical protein [Brassicibacter mesophilus]|jgi:hypothetical protein|uniref:hypothetical protein n=1 Tax=Brassicibacter mesophilus TaxID=745119 RepID=UPI003D200C89
MQKLQDYVKRHESIKLEDMDITDLTDLEEMGINSEEFALELKIPKSYINKLFNEYINDF